MFSCYIGKVSDVRGVCIELLNSKLSVELPVVVNVNVWNKDGSLTKDIKCVSIRRNSLNSRPRLISEDGKVIELSHCVEGGLVEEFRNILKFLKEQYDAKQRSEYTQIVSKALGRDLISELKGVGVKLNNVSSMGETNVVRLTGMNKEDLTTTASDELSRLATLVKSIDNVIQEVNWADSVKTNYKNLSVEDKANYHKVRHLQAGYSHKSVHGALRDIWHETSQFETEIPVIGNLGFIEDVVEDVNEYLLINGIKKVYLCEESTAVTSNLYHLVKNGWIVSEVTELKQRGTWRDGYTHSLVLHHK